MPARRQLRGVGDDAVARLATWTRRTRVVLHRARRRAVRHVAVGRSRRRAVRTVRRPVGHAGARARLRRRRSAAGASLAGVGRRGARLVGRHARTLPASRSGAGPRRGAPPRDDRFDGPRPHVPVDLPRRFDVRPADRRRHRTADAAADRRAPRPGRSGADPAVRTVRRSGRRMGEGADVDRARRHGAALHHRLRRA